MLNPDGMPRPRVRALGARSMVSHREPGVDVDVTRLLRLPLPTLSSDVAIGDLDDLLSAVKAKLRLTVADPLAEIPELRALNAAFVVQTSVLECVAALDQLHLTLSHELARRQRLEMELFEAQIALAQARAQPIGIQAGSGGAATSRCTTA